MIRNNDREDVRYGRRSKAGNYVHHDATSEIYDGVPWQLALESNMESALKKSMQNDTILAAKQEWYQKNWMKLDLIDPEKWALFPGDVVKVVRKSHRKLISDACITFLYLFVADYEKFGVVGRIDITLGFVYVSGINMTHAEQEIFESIREPLAYRDVKLLKFGNLLMNLAANGDNAQENDLSNYQ